MGAIEALLSVPPEIEKGLASGLYERIGGVVRDRATKQIVAWLRDGVSLESLDPLTKLTHTVTQPLALMTASGGLLNVAISSASLVAVLRRLERLSAQLDSLSAEIKDEFQRDRHTRFLAAVHAAGDALDTHEENIRGERIVHALRDLNEALIAAREDYRDAYKRGLLELAQQYLLRGMYAVTAITRCHLELNEQAKARRRLDEHHTEFAKYAWDIADLWLGEKAAAYLHPAFDLDEVRRFFAVQLWIHSADDLYPVLDRLRVDFWRDEILPDDGAVLLERVRGFRKGMVSASKAHLITRLMQAELLMENVQRLEGYRLEIAELRMAFGEWCTKTGDNGGILVDTEAVQLRQA